MVTIEELLQLMVQRGGSDLHCTAGAPPKIRVHGEMLSTEHDVFTPDMTQKLVYSFLTSDQIAKFEKNLELDLSFGVDGLGRFRVNVFQQRGAVGCVLRIIPYEIKNFTQLGLPIDVCTKLCREPKGLILVTGATGSGKSTTMAAMINEINETEQVHIITIEDPIEFVHRNKKALFNQREVGSDTHGFKEALKSVLRQDPDVVLVGEMRDQETIEAALTLAETGHLTFGTLHTSDTVQTISRIVDVFPAYQQQQIRTQLAFSLVGVFCQQLIPKTGGKGRVMAAEIMISNAAVKALIRDDKAHQIYSIIQTGGKLGMKTMNQSLADHVKSGAITMDEAMTRTTDTEDLKRLLARS
ncbi:MAG: type IV pilus twitching motility protein PilT [Planctomycetaceae bacterium]|nr:type IV pilus twitching motility protein PilT [Planctomycetota bacterium]NUN51448.1 type IV pilus twitching motility protein PilT [Planctomycetaceae bacterium]